MLGQRAQPALEAILHRGPDGRGARFFAFDADAGAVEKTRERAFEGANVFLGHSRLAILDVTDSGLQPMEREGMWVTFNGEIYNFVELREELAQLGFRTTSGSDTEVLLLAYRAWGKNAFARLRGMFALCLFDPAAGELVLARDQLGIKPLFYAVNESRLVFGSEIKALLASQLVSDEIDRQAIWDYFTFLYAPNPATVYREVRQLPPGHVATLSLRTWKWSERRFHHLRRRRELERAEPEELAERLVASLRRAVREQMRSDVPVGTFLSGGIDSTIVTGLMREHASEVNSFTVVFPDPAYRHFDEGEVARDIAAHLGTAHMELPVQVEQPELFLSLLSHFDQPFANPTFLLMYLICEKAREHIKVALCGAGGDELFAPHLSSERCLDTLDLTGLEACSVPVELSHRWLLRAEPTG